MLIKIDELRSLLKTLPYSLYRDQAPKGTNYPYMVYTYDSTENMHASSKVYRRMRTYQLSLFTTGTEEDLLPIENLLDENNIRYHDFYATPGSENDDTVTNFYTEINVMADG
ncbi:MAG: hypothetical protein E7152_15680 [Enterococcus casseliflavus]|nr:hypothetical protein [Enterococcus casseliflavus]